MQRREKDLFALMSGGKTFGLISFSNIESDNTTAKNEAEEVI
jgi:hypothetical protein